MQLTGLHTNVGSRPYVGVIDERESAAQDGDGQSRPRAGDGSTLVVLINAVAASLGGLYTATQSIVVSALAAGLMCLLALFLALRRQENR